MEKKLGRFSLYTMAVGNVIGAGVFALLGMAVETSGHAAWVSYGLALLMGIVYNLPMIFCSSALLFEGGAFTIAGDIYGKRIGGLYALCFFLEFTSLPFYSNALASYAATILPGINERALSVAVIALFFIINIIGITATTRVQNMFVIILFVSVFSFVLYGFKDVDWDLLNPATNPNFMPNGFSGVYQGAMILMFSTFAYYFIMFLGKDCKRPKKDIPIAILLAMATIVCMYLGICIVCTGIVPLEHIAGQPLTAVFKEVVPPQLFAAFMICAPFMAITTTINGLILAVSQPLNAAARNGFLPQVFQKKIGKNGNPFLILIIGFCLAALPLILGWDSNTLANSYLMIDIGVSVLLMISLIQVPRKYPKAWANREFLRNLPTGVFYGCCVLAMVVQVLIVYNSVTSIKLYIVIVTVLFITAAFIYSGYRVKRNLVGDFTGSIREE